MYVTPLEDTLARYWGYVTFRPLQREGTTEVPLPSRRPCQWPDAAEAIVITTNQTTAQSSPSESAQVVKQ